MINKKCMERAAFSFPARGTRHGYQFTEISIAVNVKSHEGGGFGVTIK